MSEASAADAQTPRRPVIGLALGSGSARGWAHIGILRELEAIGIVPDIITGTSIGALVGAAAVAGRLDRLEDWVSELTRLQTARFFELNRSLKGFVNTRRLHDYLNEVIADDSLPIESLPRRYAAVATDLYSGRELWLDKGPLIEAVWASISLPGLFPAIRQGQRWLVDGGLVNPVPVSVCRALGAEVVIAVNLNGDIVGKHFRRVERSASSGTHSLTARLTDLVMEYTGGFFQRDSEAAPPGMFEAIAGSINITQDRITRSRMAGDPPDVLLTPRLAQIGLLEFYRAREAMEEGRQCVRRMRDSLDWALAAGID